MVPRQQSMRMLVVHGSPGQGKAQVVSAAVARLKSDFPSGGAYYADLHDATNKDMLVSRWVGSGAD